MEVIKKYDNRKLYSTKLSRYVTLGYIADLVRTNVPFQIVNHKTNNDVTNSTLSEVVRTLKLNNNELVSIIKGS